MKVLKNISELKEFSHAGVLTTASLLLVTSAVCGTCAGFKPAYMALERRVGDFCNLCVIEAEVVGGRPLLREAFSVQFDKRYKGFPSLFIITNGGAHEVPYEPIMWNKNLSKFDIDAMTTYIKKYLFGKGSP